MNTFRTARFFRRLWRLQRRRQRFAFRFRPKEDPRNNAARTLDLLVLAAACGLGALVLLARFWPPVLTLPVALAAAAAGGAAARRFQKKREQLRRQRYRLWLAGQKCREEIKKLTTREEVVVFTSLLLAALPQFTELRVNRRSGEKTKAPSIIRSAALCARYKGVPVAVQCFAPAASGPEEEVALLQALGRFLGRRGLRSALLVAPAPLSGEARRVIAALRKQYRVVTLTEEKLVELALQAGRQPAAGDGLEAAAEKKAEAEQKLILAPRKGRGHLLAAGVLWLVYAIASPAGFWSGVYLVLIAVNLVLALLCLAANRPDDDFDLEDLEIQP